MDKIAMIGVGILAFVSLLLEAETASRTVDWAMLLKMLAHDTGATNIEIGRAAGMGAAIITKIRNECSGFCAGDQAIALVCMFLKNTNRELPLVGEHHEISTHQSVECTENGKKT